MPESRLKLIIQANALVEALLAAVCMVSHAKVAQLFGLPSLIAILIGFSLALGSAFWFRVAAKEPVSTRYTTFGAAANLAITVAVVVALVFRVIHVSANASRALMAIAAIHACFGLTQLVLLNHSDHTYSHPQVVVV